MKLIGFTHAPRRGALPHAHGRQVALINKSGSNYSRIATSNRFTPATRYKVSAHRSTRGHAEPSLKLPFRTSSVVISIPPRNTGKRTGREIIGRRIPFNLEVLATAARSAKSEASALEAPRPTKHREGNIPDTSLLRLIANRSTSTMKLTEKKRVITTTFATYI
jgi:hypothetical protein